MADNLHTVWATGALLGIRCAACDHRAVLSPAELPVTRRAWLIIARDWKKMAEREEARVASVEKTERA